MNTVGLTKGILVKEVIIDRKISVAIGVTSFIIFTALGAFVRLPLPFTPVPITLQTFFVLLAGAMLGKKPGALSQAGYLLAGVIGLPVFAAASSGTAALFGPTGGYLLGFVAAGWVVGNMIGSKDDLSLGQIMIAMSSGLAVIYLSGSLWLALLLELNLKQVLALGVLPFLPGAVLKLFLASSIYFKIQQRVKVIFK